ncbi:hypothetical protein F4861DRAFT_490320 [Xylaria intraflava]|nr:hypothetical protein F4861DRAFT_490320 [Xylaria intraflava]
MLDRHSTEAAASLMLRAWVLHCQVLAAGPSMPVNPVNHLARPRPRPHGQESPDRCVEGDRSIYGPMVGSSLDYNKSTNEQMDERTAGRMDKPKNVTALFRHEARERTGPGQKKRKVLPCPFGDHTTGT